jgi:hypothetical protein
MTAQAQDTAPGAHAIAASRHDFATTVARPQ